MTLFTPLRDQLGADVFQIPGEFDPARHVHDFLVGAPEGTQILGIAYPRTTQEVSEILRFCNDHDLKVTPQADGVRGGRRCGDAVRRGGDDGDEAFRGQDRAVGLDQGLLEGALELPHVARPGVEPEFVHRFGGDAIGVLPQFAAEPPEEPPAERVKSCGLWVEP